MSDSHVPASLEIKPRQMHFDFEKISLVAWHLAEEIEHKSVCFDLYQELCGSAILRYVTAIAVNTVILFETLFLSILLLLADNQLSTYSDWRAFFKYVFGKNGVWHSLLDWEYLAFFKKGFHPWQVDDRHLVEKWKSMYPQPSTEVVTGKNWILS